MTNATQTLTLAAFIEARVAEDEAIATAAGHGCGYVHRHNGGWVEVELPEAHNDRPVYEMRFIRRFDPARVLAECAAKRAIVRALAADTEARDPSEGGKGARWAKREVVKALAAVYADHPDYDEAWA